MFWRKEDFPEFEILIPNAFNAFTVFDVVGDELDHLRV